jgi:exodeoxyribonuclease V alpha subunit
MLNLSRAELGRLIRDAEKGMGFSLDPSQQQAVLAILSSTRAVHTVTAGPGCGKTAIMEVLVQVLAARNARSTDYGFAAPTGKAAKVLGARIARINATARTIHATLGVNEDGFEHNANNLLGFKVLVIDESSMLDLLLLDALLQATPMDTHLVLLGDTQQLPSVSPGNCLADLLSLPFDHHRLSKVHRNQGGILEVVNRAAAGESDTVNREDVRFIPELPEATEQTVDAVITYYAKAAEGLEGGLASVCLLVARRKGKSDTPGWNTTYLNQRLRERFNPGGLKVPGAPLRVGDRIIIRKNILIRIPDEKGDKFRQVVNGDTGSIERVATRSDTGRLEHLVLALDDGTRVPYPAEHLANLDLAYAMTVHSAQGSEYRRVVFLCINGSPSFVHRGIVFTAYSRARAHLTVIGNPTVLANILRRPQPARLSGLVERVTALQLISN